MVPVMKKHRLREQLPLLLPTLARFALFNFLYPMKKRPLQPRAMCLYVTYRCNMRCQMCGIWKLPLSATGNEWSVTELEKMLDGPFFRRIEFVNLNGGEPNLRADLIEIAQTIVNRLPRLRHLSLNTNGLPSQRCVENIRRIFALCRQRGIRFSVSVSLHRIGAAYDETAGIPDAFARVTQTIQALLPFTRERGFHLSLNCVLTPRTIRGAEEVWQWSLDMGVPVNFTVAEARERFNNIDDKPSVSFTDPDDRRLLIAFLRRLSCEKKRVGHHAIRYRELAEMIERGQPRRLSCHYALAGFILGWDGTMFYCKKSSPLENCRTTPPSEIYFNPENIDYRTRELIRGECSSCLPNTFNKIEMEKDLLKLIKMFP